MILNESPSPSIQALQSSGQMLAVILSFALSWIGIKRRHFQQSRSPHQSFRLWVPLTLIDTVGRWGGEEFLAILPETTVPEAQAIAERIRIEVSQQPIAIGAGIYLTCSIGLARYPTHATEMDALINAADQAMYAAKQLGRNQHRVIDEPAVQMLVASGGCSEGDREEAALKGIVKTLTSLISQRDTALGEHSQAVADMVEQIASRMGIPAPEAHVFQVAGQLHDLGKIGVPDAILQKPTPLTEKEWQRIKLHPIIGAEVVANIGALRPLSPVIRAHHEQ